MLKNIEDKGGKLPTLIDYDHVKLILDEAEKHGLKYEVGETAKVYMDRDKMSLVESHQHAFQDWVK